MRSTRLSSKFVGGGALFNGSGHSPISTQDSGGIAGRTNGERVRGDDGNPRAVPGVRGERGCSALAWSMRTSARRQLPSCLVSTTWSLLPGEIKPVSSLSTLLPIRTMSGLMPTTMRCATLR